MARITTWPELLRPTLVSGIIRARAEMSLLEEAEHKCSLHLLSQMDPRSGSPSTLWTITHNKDLLHLTARNNFRIRLVLGCHGLESDAARFRKRRGELEAGSSTCRGSHPLLGYMPRPLTETKRAATRSDPRARLPDPECDPTAFTLALLGIPWIET